MDAKAIAETSAGTAQSSREALGWVSDPRNEKKISQERAAIEQKLRRVVNEAHRLQRAVLRPNCVGVFGPSQAGKSYLISVLARKGHERLIAKFDGDRPEIDFIQDINPLGGDESTGVVTRFTMHPQTAPAGFPVCLRLLSQTDIVKILVNSYFQDGDQEYEKVLDTATLERILGEAEAAAGAAKLDVFNENDAWELQEYVQKNSGGAANANVIEPFWARIAGVAPRLGIAERGKLLAVLWGRHATYTTIYVRLVEALAKLAFEQDAFCAVTSLVPSKESIINVAALDRINDDAADMLDVCVANGSVVKLTRPVVTAIIAELRIVCRDQPLDFFAHTDLLDFPGYRARFKRPLETFFRDAADTAPKDVFLRGKVDYLFQRYTADLELTTMVLCVPDSVMNVPNLPKAVETWVGMTHGATPERRVGKPNLLFFAMTKFDNSLQRKAGGGDDKHAETFQIRFNASLSAFSKVEPSWVRQWFPRQPFQNVFLIRNPNVQFMGVINYDGPTEVGVNPAELPRLQALREAFVTLPTAIDHFADPGGAWDALMELNNGGAGYLARALARVCVADLKLGQIAARLTEIRRDLLDLLGRYYVSEDLEKRRQERLAVVDNEVFVDFEACAMSVSFGSALRGLMIDGSDLHAALVEALNRPSAEPGTDATPRGTRTIFVGGGKKPPAPPVDARADRSARLAEAALSCWASFLHTRLEDVVFGRRIGIGHNALRDMIAEIGGAARRIDLADRISAELRLRAAPNEQPEAIARKAALVAERLINRFVSELDFDRIDPQTQLQQFSEDLEEPVFAARETAFDSLGIGEEQPDFTSGFMMQWGIAFRASVSQNAVSKGGSIENAAQNARLGKILQALSV